MYMYNNMLTSKQKEFYKENGFLKLEGLFDPEELDKLATEYEELFERKNGENSNMKAIWDGDWKVKFEGGDGGKVAFEDVHVFSIHNLQMHSSVFTHLLLHSKLLDAVEDVMETPNILLHHTKAHLKPPGIGAPFPMHQDYHYFPYEKDSMLAVFLHLDDTTPENGGLAVFPGSHKLGPLPDMSDKPGVHYVDQVEYSLEKAVPIEAKKGDVLIFSYLLVHGSYMNT